MVDFQPDYSNVVQAARNQRPERLPLYEHLISESVMEEIMDTTIAPLAGGDDADQREYIRRYIDFFRQMGYDTVSFERCIGPIMPGSGALGGPEKEGVIRNREDFEQYPWDSLPERFFAAYDPIFTLLAEELPARMKAIGGPGNGVFELVQDVVGYTRLCYISADDPELYAGLFAAVGNTMAAIWEEFLCRYGDSYAVCRFGDDLGYKTSTLLSQEDINEYIIPQYTRVVDLVHRAGKPFLLHSCGNIFGVMEELISAAGIDAKHSNEDQIAPFTAWVERYGDRIAFFGGLDTDVLCRKQPGEIRAAVRAVLDALGEPRGVAFGSGNSIPDYVPAEGYLAMVEEVRRCRGEDV